MRCLVFSKKVQRKRVTLVTSGQPSDGQVDGQESPSAEAGAHSSPWTRSGLPVVPSSPFSPRPTALPAPPHLSAPFSGAPVPPVTWPPWAAHRDHFTQADTQTRSYVAHGVALSRTKGCVMGAQDGRPLGPREWVRIAHQYGASWGNHGQEGSPTVLLGPWGPHPVLGTRRAREATPQRAATQAQEQPTASKASVSQYVGSGQQLMMKVAAKLPLRSPSVSTKVPRIGLEKRMK